MVFVSLALALPVFFALEARAEPSPVLAPLRTLERLGLPVLAADRSIGVGYSVLSENDRERLSLASHQAGKCGGYELLPSLKANTAAEGRKLLAELGQRAARDKKIQALASVKLEKKPEVVEALQDLKEENIRATVQWLSSYPSRYNKLPDPNRHVRDLELRVRDLLKNYSGPFSVEQISHRNTRQNTLRARLVGKSRPTEIIVLGGHLDSINQGWFGGNSELAPGADDNASGSASLVEALRVIAGRGQPERTLEFFWYAGEESGLLGSAEIAQSYKAANKDVVAVLQLDMTMFPGSGELVIANIGDFTSPWLRSYLESLNDVYIGARLIPDECGYACSDHASWYRQGYPTLMPFESHSDQMNRAIHTDNDVIGPRSSFRHALAFAKIALVFGMDLGRSSLREP
jgi:bacterial leucyl aminopeptidase